MSDAGRILDMEAKLRSLLKGEFSSLSITFNDDACNYRPASLDGYEHAEWVNDEERDKAIADNAVWVLQWYPDTPVGFYRVAGATLASVVDAALEVGK